MKVNNKRTAFNSKFETWKKSRQSRAMELRESAQNKPTINFSSKIERKPYALTENYLKENYGGKYTVKNNVYTVKCKGRRELRDLISECKARGYKYKFDKTLNEDYKYDFSFKANNTKSQKKESIKIEPITQPRLRESIFEEKAPSKPTLGKRDTSKGVDESVVTNKLKARRQKKFETKEEPKTTDEQPLKEDLQLLGDLEDFTPSDKALPLWTEIKEKGLLRDLDKLLGELYPKGTTIEDFDDLLVYSPDFIRKMLDLEEKQEEKEVEQELEEPIEEPVEEPIEDEVEQPQEEPDENDMSVMQELIDDEEETTEPSEDQNNQPKVDREKYLSNETGYDENDLSVLDDMINDDED